MAGAGSRFAKIGINKPKHEITAFGKSLFTWSMESLTDFFQYEFIFIHRTENFNKEFIVEECRKLGIAKTTFIPLNEITSGQATTVMMCNDFIDNQESICIYNIDTYVEPNEILEDKIIANCEGYLPSFEAEGDKWSFVKTEENSNKVIDVSEKIRISNLGTIGFYYFKKWIDFKTISVEKQNEIIKNYKENYIAPMYKYLIEDKKSVYTSIIPNNKIHVLGTPEDLTDFCPNFLQEN